MSSKIESSKNTDSAGVNRQRNRVTRRLRTVAQNYATAYSLAVVPMYAMKNGNCMCHLGKECRNPGKHPASPNGVKDATSDAELVKRAWQSYPRANIGIATGKTSGIVVLDIDPRNGGDLTLQNLEGALGALPFTVTANTGGGGRHLVFKYPKFSVPKDSAGKVLGKGVDILSDGAIMIAPPSRHVSGRRYKWVEGRSFDDIDVAELPEAWLAKLTAQAGAENENSAKPVCGDQTGEAKIAEGTRNNTLTAIAGVLRHHGADAETIQTALVALNRSRCEPPLEPEEVEKISRSVAAYPIGRSNEDEAERLVRLVLSMHFADGKHLIYGADGRFWLFTGQRWEIAATAWIKSIILKTIEFAPRAKKITTAALISQVFTVLTSKLASRDDLLAISAKPACVVNCSNGELWIDDKGQVELKPHRPESYLRHCTGFAYDPNAKCPMYDKALRQIFSKSGDARKTRQFWNEIVGYLIQPQRDIPLVVILLGSGANGKTILSKLLTKLIGPEQVLARPVEDLGNNRFVKGDLFGKLLFLDDDVKAGARLPDGTLKTISEEKQVSGEVKYGPSFTFMVRTIPILLCNNVPSLADVSDGMIRRLTVIPFDKKFDGKERDLKLYDRIIATELPGILNRAIAGYRRLRKRGDLKPPRPVRKAKQAWLRQANPLPAFLEERCKRDPNGHCLLADLYSAYKVWASDAGYTITQNKLSFRRNIEHMGFRVAHSNRGNSVYGMILGK